MTTPEIIVAVAVARGGGGSASLAQKGLVRIETELALYTSYRVSASSDILILQSHKHTCSTHRSADCDSVRRLRECEGQKLLELDKCIPVCWAREIKVGTSF